MFRLSILSRSCQIKSLPKSSLSSSLLSSSSSSLPLRFVQTTRRFHFFLKRNNNNNGIMIKRNNNLIIMNVTSDCYHPKKNVPLYYTVTRNYHYSSSMLLTSQDNQQQEQGIPITRSSKRSNDNYYIHSAVENVITNHGNDKGDDDNDDDDDDYDYKNYNDADDDNDDDDGDNDDFQKMLHDELLQEQHEKKERQKQRQQLQILQSQSNNIPRRRLDVAIVGAPNAGKSQLLNALTQSTVAAVSRKRHTTRDGILGARTDINENCQVVFCDTPGFLQLNVAKEERLNRDLIVSAPTALEYVDYSLLVVDAARTLTDRYKDAMLTLIQHALHSQGRDEGIHNDDDDNNNNNENKTDNAETNKNSLSEPLQPKFAIVLNKVDLVEPKTLLLDLAVEIAELADQSTMDYFNENIINKNNNNDDDITIDSLLQVAPPIFYVSALHNDGIDDLWDHLVELSTPCNSWIVSPNQVTNMPLVQRIEEIIREKIYRCLHREVPHSVYQVNRMLRHHAPTKTLIIHQDLVVTTKSHYQLVLGSNGRTLDRIKTTALRDLQKIFQRPVQLHLHVKWNKSKQRNLETTEYE